MSDDRRYLLGSCLLQLSKLSLNQAGAKDGGNFEHKLHILYQFCMSDVCRFVVRTPLERLKSPASPAQSWIQVG